MTLQEHIAQEPLWLQSWLTWMGVLNLAAVLFIVRWKDGRLRLGHVEAFAILGAIVVAVVVMEWLFAHLGYVRLLGLGHILAWTPLAIYLWRRLPSHSMGSIFGGYLRVLLATIVISLVIDYIDAARYLAGDGALT